MLCQNCGKNEANVRYTQIINGVKKQMALCSECAEELGIDKIDFNMPINFSSFLTDMFDEYNSYIPELVKSNNLVCDSCNMSYDEFLSNGKFGCEKCYENFENKVNALLKNIQGVDIHSGRVANSLLDSSKIDNDNKDKSIKEKVSKNDNKDDKKEESVNSKLEELKKRLEKEVKEERYEDAAKTRDEIKKLEK